jgi:hypothetical protein
MLQRDRSSVFVRWRNATSAGAKIITAKTGPIEKPALDIPSNPVRRASLARVSGQD